MDKIQDIVQTLVTAIMDALESFFLSFTVPTGKSLKYSLLILLGFLAYSIFGELLGLPSFVQWQEALFAVIIVAAVLLIDEGNRSFIKGLTEDLKGKVIKDKEGKSDEQQD